MKKVIRFLISALIAAIMVCICTMVVSAVDITDFEYNVSKIDYGTYTSDYTCFVIGSYNGDDSQLIISDELFPMSEYKYDKIRVEQNAFSDCDTLEMIVFPENTERIITGGITGCDSLKTLVFLGADTIIDLDNCDSCHPELTIYGTKGSTAEKFANDRNLTFIELKTGSCILTATSLSSGARLSWNDCGADEYTLYAVSENGKKTKLYSGAKLSYTFSVRETEAYGFYVSADMGFFDITSNTVYKRAGKVSVLTAPIVKKSSSGFSVKLSWDVVEGADEYDIYYAKKGDKKFKLLDSTAKSSYTYTASSANTYYFKVSAKSESYGILTAKSVGSNQITVALKMKTLATPVVSVRNWGGVSAKLSWKKISGATEYEIYFAKKGDKAFKLLTTTTELNYTYTADAKNTYYFKVAAKEYSESGVLIGKSAKSKQLTIKLNGSSLAVYENGYYRDVKSTDPEYGTGVKRVFVECQNKVGRDIPAGWYVLYPIDKSINYTAFNGIKPQVPESNYALNFTSSFTGDTLMIYAEEGKYLTLNCCYAVKYNERVKLPTGKDSCIVWEGNNFNRGIYKLAYDGTYGVYKNGVLVIKSMWCTIADVKTGKKLDIPALTLMSEDINKSPVIKLEDGQILLLEQGATLIL